MDKGEEFLDDARESVLNRRVEEKERLLKRAWVGTVIVWGLVLLFALMLDVQMRYWERQPFIPLSLMNRWHSGI